MAPLGTSWAGARPLRCCRRVRSQCSHQTHRGTFLTRRPAAETRRAFPTTATRRPTVRASARRHPRRSPGSSVSRRPAAAAARSPTPAASPQPSTPGIPTSASGPTSTGTPPLAGTWSRARVRSSARSPTPTARARAVPTTGTTSGVCCTMSPAGILSVPIVAGTRTTSTSRGSRWAGCPRCSLRRPSATTSTTWGPTARRPSPRALPPADPTMTST
mmetsp:Transcript_87177/g.231629  ORF Transcript_87177/g.231629 Transcript_87177/m.231629 type:complete len:217 (-) Transcript_87177:335-985(-)